MRPACFQIWCYDAHGLYFFRIFLVDLCGWFCTIPTYEIYGWFLPHCLQHGKWEFTISARTSHTSKLPTESKHIFHGTAGLQRHHQLLNMPPAPATFFWLLSFINQYLPTSYLLARPDCRLKQVTLVWLLFWKGGGLSQRWWVQQNGLWNMGVLSSNRRLLCFHRQFW